MKTILPWLRYLAILPGFLPASLSAQTGNDISQKTFSRTLFNFSEPEGWRITGNGNAGNSSLKGKELALDFTSGATSVSISPTILRNQAELIIRAYLSCIISGIDS